MIITYCAIKTKTLRPKTAHEQIQKTETTIYLLVKDRSSNPSTVLEQN
jgi:hypothetical protein